MQFFAEPVPVGRMRTEKKSYSSAWRWWQAAMKDLEISAVATTQRKQITNFLLVFFRTYRIFRSYARSLQQQQDKVLVAVKWIAWIIFNTCAFSFFWKAANTIIFFLETKGFSSSSPPTMRALSARPSQSLVVSLTLYNERRKRKFSVDEHDKETIIHRTLSHR